MPKNYEVIVSGIPEALYAGKSLEMAESVYRTARNKYADYRKRVTLWRVIRFRVFSWYVELAREMTS